MNFSRIFKKATILTVAILFTFGAPPADAQVSALGHISASVIGALNVSELLSIKFGNFSMSCTNSTCDNQSSITLSDNGTRTMTMAGAENIVLLNGLSGITNGTAQETGAQSPGFYSINAGGEGTGMQNIYISFADANGDIIDINHPANHVLLSGPAANAFAVDTFTFEGDTGTNGYQQQTQATTDVYGTYVPLVNGNLTLRVGATLHTTAGPTPPPGQYTGTFFILVSY